MSTNSLLPEVAIEPGRFALICLSHAGGGAAGFYRWRSQLPAWLEVFPICPPGRETRVHERPFRQLTQLVAEATDVIAPLTTDPFALVGLSLGAVAAFELAREIRRRSLPGPRLLVVAASRAPHEPGPESLIHELPDDEFLQQLDEQYQGIPNEIARDRELLQLLLPTLRADVCMLETYAYREEAPLDVELLAMGGSEDRAVTATDLMSWRRHTTRSFSARQLPGGHFFLLDSTRGSNPALQVIINRLARIVPD